MNITKAGEVLQFYDSVLTKQGVPVKQITYYTRRGYTHNELLSHCRYLISLSEDLIDQGKVKKIMRWLGYIQGILCATGVYSIEEIKNHSKP